MIIPMLFMIVLRKEVEGSAVYLPRHGGRIDWRLEWRVLWSVGWLVEQWTSILIASFSASHC